MVVAAAPLVLAGFIALLWLVATEQVWWPALENLSASLGPVVGGAVRQMLGGIKSMLDNGAHWVDGLAAPAVTLAWGLYWFAYQRSHAVPGALNAAWQALNRLQTQWIPAQLSALGDWAQGQFSLLHAQLLSAVAGAEAQASAALASLGNWTQQQLAQLHAQEVQDFQAAEATAQAEVSSLGNWAQQQLAQLHAELLQQVSDLEGLLNIDLGNVSTQLQQLFAQAEADIQAGVAGAEAQAQAGLGSLQNLLQGQIAQQAAIASAAVAVAEGEIANILNMRCIKVCDPLGALGEALQLLDVGALLAFLGEAAANPGAAQDFLQNTFAPGIEAVIGDAEALIGLSGKG